MGEYKVKFEVFEGPLDLLLYLIKKEEVDIYEVNLTKLATQFIEYIELMRMLDLEIAGEFLVMASTLMYIKSKELLPRDQQAAATEVEEEGEDPRWELIRQLVAYKKFKDAAGQLQNLEVAQENTFARIPGKVEFDVAPAKPKAEVSIFELLNAVNSILKRFNEKAPTRDIFEDKWTVSEKIENIRQALTERGRLRFSELFAAATSRTEIVVTFLAVLELTRMKHIWVAQDADFGDIDITPAPEQPAIPAEPTPENMVQGELPVTETQPAIAPTVVIDVQSGPGKP